MIYFHKNMNPKRGPLYEVYKVPLYTLRLTVMDLNRVWFQTGLL